MRLVRNAVACAALACASLSFSTPAMADAQSDAKDLFAKGRELRQAGDCNAAAAMFRKAYQVYPQGLGSLRNLAECEEAIGHYASARRAWLDLKRGLNTVKDDSKYEGWDNDAQEAAARLKPKVALVTVDVIVKTPEGEGPANERSGVDLFVNGEKVAPNLIGTELDRDPSTYVFRAQAPDADPVEQRVSLAAGDVRVIRMRLVRTPRIGPTPEEIEKDARAKTRRTIGVGLMGGGAALLVGSLVTFLIRGSARDELEEKCVTPNGVPIDVETGPCPSAAQDAKDRGQAMSIVSPVLLAAGVVAIGAGVTLFATSPSQLNKEKTADGGFKLLAGPARLDAVWKF